MSKYRLHLYSYKGIHYLIIYIVGVLIKPNPEPKPKPKTIVNPSCSIWFEYNIDNINVDMVGSL